MGLRIPFCACLSIGLQQSPIGNSSVRKDKKIAHPDKPDGL
jgi:hypothetical protein